MGCRKSGRSGHHSVKISAKRSRNGSVAANDLLNVLRRRFAPLSLCGTGSAPLVQALEAPGSSHCRQEWWCCEAGFERAAYALHSPDSLSGSNARSQIRAVSPSPVPAISISFCAPRCVGNITLGEVLNRHEG